MNLKDRLKQDLKDAMKAKDTNKRDAIRAITTMIKQVEVDQRVSLNDDEVVKLIQKGVKQREDAIEQFKAGSRDDLVEKEQYQIDIFSLYLPKQLTDDELLSIVKNIIAKVGATSMKDMGKIMPKAKEQVGAKADGKRINQAVKQLLN
jgi:uncharacterized protein YqeY